MISFALCDIPRGAIGPPFAQGYRSRGFLDRRGSLWQGVIMSSMHLNAESLPWLRLFHPFPSFLVTASCVAFAEIALAGQSMPDRVARLALSVLCSQFAIGCANDVVDVQLDRATKPWKPIARGIVSSGTAAGLAVALSLACLGLSLSLPWPTALAASFGLGCGLAYDLWLKRSRWSWLPYGLAIPTLPLWSWLAVGRFSPALLVAYPLGVLLGLALHLANTLPDLDGDAAFGVMGLAHMLGARRSQIVCWAALLLAQALTLALAPVLGYSGAWYPLGLSISLLLLAATVVLNRVRPSSGTQQVSFGLVALSCLSLALGWLAGTIAK
jgi:4-hydroxybenzoate polyprenyltransferase